MSPELIAAYENYCAFCISRGSEPANIVTFCLMIAEKFVEPTL